MSVVYAHTVSASRSELKTEDGLTRLTVRMPMFELDHLAQADRGLAKHFRVAGEGPVSESCGRDGDYWECRATFLAAPGAIECRLAAVTVPHHIHTMQIGGRALVFTSTVMQQNAASVSTWPLFAFGAVLLLGVVWIIRSLRSRRRTSPQD